jgi:hypothetical protein
MRISCTGAYAYRISLLLNIPEQQTTDGGDRLVIGDCCRDPRHPAVPLRKHTSTHSDDITSVHFSGSSSSSSSADERSSHLLLSGSTDGLVCISNAKEQDEDEAVVYVGNLGSSIAQTGWMPSRGGAARTTGVWASTDMETFSVWSDEVRNAKQHRLRLLESLPESLLTFPSSIFTTVIWTFVNPLFTHKPEHGSPTISLDVTRQKRLT